MHGVLVALVQNNLFAMVRIKKIEPTTNEQGEVVLPYTSLKIEFDKEEEVWFCQCKQTKTPPFCDGSHKAIGNK